MLHFIGSYAIPTVPTYNSPARSKLLVLDNLETLLLGGGGVFPRVLRNRADALKVESGEGRETRRCRLYRSIQSLFKKLFDSGIFIRKPKKSSKSHIRCV